MSQDQGSVVNPDTGEVIEGQMVSAQSVGMGAIVRAEIDMQIATAKQYPRMVSNVLKEAGELACLDEDTATSMWYAIPRGGKNITGPSVRLAEVFASCWGNLRVQTEIVESNDDYVTVRAAAHDLEKNIAIAVSKRRRVTKKRSAMRPDADDIQIAGLAGMSIALRDAIFKVIPRVYIDQVMTKAQKVGLGKAESIVGARTKIIDLIKKAGVTEDRIFSVLGVKGMADIGVDEIVALRGFHTAIKEGEARIESIFPLLEPKPTAGNEATAEALKKAQEKAAPAKQEAKAPKAEEKQPEPKQEEVKKPKATKKPEPVKEPERSPPEEVVDADSIDGQMQPDPDPEEEVEPGATADEEVEVQVPAWYTTWQTNIAALDKPNRAEQILRSLISQLREPINEQYKNEYQDLCCAWVDKVAGVTQTLSYIAVFEKSILPLKPLVDETTYSYISTAIANRKQQLAK